MVEIKFELFNNAGRCFNTAGICRRILRAELSLFVMDVVSNENISALDFFESLNLKVFCFDIFFSVALLVVSPGSLVGFSVLLGDF